MVFVQETLGSAARHPARAAVARVDLSPDLRRDLPRPAAVGLLDDGVAREESGSRRAEEHEPVRSLHRGLLAQLADVAHEGRGRRRDPRGPAADDDRPVLVPLVGVARCVDELGRARVGRHLLGLLCLPTWARLRPRGGLEHELEGLRVLEPLAEALARRVHILAEPDQHLERQLEADPARRRLA